MKGAFVKAQKRVGFEFGAFRAEFAVGAMVVFAVNVNHESDSFFLAFHTFMFWVWRLDLHAKSTPAIRHQRHIRVYPKT